MVEITLQECWYARRILEQGGNQAISDGVLSSTNAKNLKNERVLQPKLAILNLGEVLFEFMTLKHYSPKPNNEEYITRFY